MFASSYSPLLKFYGRSTLKLKLLRSRYREAFIAAPDVPWTTSPNEHADVTTVRAIGPGAGNMTYILLGGAGHLVRSSCNLQDDY